MTTPDNKPTSLEDILSKFGVAYANIYNGNDVRSTFAGIKAEAIAAIEALVPAKPMSAEVVDKNNVTLDEAVEMAALQGFALAIDIIQRNFKGQTAAEGKQ